MRLGFEPMIMKLWVKHITHFLHISLNNYEYC